MLRNAVQFRDRRYITEQADGGVRVQMELQRRHEHVNKHVLPVERDGELNRRAVRNTINDAQRLLD